MTGACDARNFRYVSVAACGAPSSSCTTEASHLYRPALVHVQGSKLVKL